MPIRSQGGTADFHLYVRDGSGNFVDPTNLSLTFRDNIGLVQTGFPVAYPGLIVKDAVGQYHYDWPIPVEFLIGTYTAQWDAILLGSPRTALETWEIVIAGSISTGSDRLMVNPDDYEAVRGLLGVTTLDVEDSDIDRTVFGPHAELLVKRRISNWAEQMTNPDLLFVMRLATVYKTACLMAESWVRGGTIGLARPLATGEGRDWAEAATQFCQGYEYWVNIADQSDTDANSGSMFYVHPLRVGGPIAVRLAQRRAGSVTMTPPEDLPWFNYPPFWKRP